MTTKDTTNFPRALPADVFGALHSEIPLTPGYLLHAAIGEASRALRLASVALQRGELLSRDLEAIRRQLTIADDFAEWLEFEADEAAPQPSVTPSPWRAAIEALRALRDHSAVGDHGTAVGEIVEELEELRTREGGRDA